MLLIVEFKQVYFTPSNKSALKLPFCRENHAKERLDLCFLCTMFVFVSIISIFFGTIILSNIYVQCHYFLIYLRVRLDGPCGALLTQNIQ